MFQLLSLRHLNNVVLNITVSPRKDNKQVLTPRFSPSASLLMKITAALFQARTHTHTRSKITQSASGENRGKHNEIIRVDLAQGFSSLFFFLFFHPSSSFSPSLKEQSGAEPGCYAVRRVRELSSSVSVSSSHPPASHLSLLNTLFSCLS